MSDQEFKRQSSAGAISLERVYQGKTVAGGPIFSLVNLKAATQYCQKFVKANNHATCIIVREESFLRIWSGVEGKESAKTSRAKVVDIDSSEGRCISAG